MLFSDTTLTPGAIHWTLLKSVEVMDKQRWKQKKGPVFVTEETTEFGKEVGLDEIHWWIFEKETDIDELLLRTQRTLKSVQALKEAAVRLKGFERKALPVGAKLTIRATKDGMIGAVKTLTIRRRKPPSLKTLCIPPGAASPSVC